MPTAINFSPRSEDVAASLSSVIAATDHIEISVVLPTYRAQECLMALYERLCNALDPLGVPFEVIFIEDCGPDDSWTVIQQLAAADRRVRGFKLSRNFGQQMAITAGLSKARGNWIVVMDCDLQDPPETIPKLYKSALAGHDIVFAKRESRKLSQLRLFANKLYFSIVNFFSGTSITGDYGSYTIISKTVRDAYLQFTDRNRHYLMILFWLGFNTTDIVYEQADRYAGESSYTLRSLIKLAIEGMFFQTTILLKLIVALGFFTSLCGLFAAVWVVLGYFQHGAPTGWTSVFALILLLGGAMLICQGIVGLYVGEIFDHVKERPLFVVAKESAQGQP